MAMIGIGILIAVWALIFIPMLLIPLLRRGADESTTDGVTPERQTADHTLDVRDIAAMSSNRDLSQAA